MTIPMVTQAVASVSSWVLLKNMTELIAGARMSRPMLIGTIATPSSRNPWRYCAPSPARSSWCADFDIWVNIAVISEVAIRLCGRM